MFARDELKYRSRDKADYSFTRSSERKFLDPFSAESTYKMTEKPQLKMQETFAGALKL